ncbi:hypothetical protein BH11ACT8_BH11ACT8_14590 [soil metagenome]
MRTFPSLVPVSALACLLAFLAPAATADPGEPGAPGDPGSSAERSPTASPWDPGARPDTATEHDAANRLDPRGTVIGTDGVPQTSDGVVGAIARPLLGGPAQRGTSGISVRKRWQVVPGVRATVWDQNDPRGPIRAYLLAIDWKAPGVSLDYANDGAVKRTAPVRTLIGHDNAVAGTNGDFFDIGDTGAPLGLGRDRQRGLLNGRQSGWTSAFSIARNGRPDIGPISVVGTIKQRPGTKITNVNSAEIFPGGIGLYTRAWGYTSGSRITAGQTKNVRVVLVRRGKVVRNTVRLPSGTRIDGQMLVGRGAGAKKLVSLKRGTRVDLHTHVQGTPKMAITGNQFLVNDGIIRVVDDREMHPRTAIGIDRDTHQILLLVVDGRQSFSRGYTMVEMANLMIDLGADEALNLDGGGSSTMLAKRKGNLALVNSPSDGFQRSVANAVEVLYTRPKR